MSERTNLTARADGPTRRQAFAGIAIAAGGAILGAPAILAAPKEVSRTAESIHQEPTFKAGRAQVYEALVDTRRFDKVTELSGSKGNAALGTEPTAISREVGGTFTLFGGHIIGRQLELIPHQRIVQAWRVADWEPGVYSIAKFELVEQGSGTRIIFDHTGFPDGKGEHLAAGWKEHYWEPLKKLLA